MINQKGNTFSQFVLENRGSGPMADVRVRQAISYAVPREDIVKAVFGGQGTATGSVGVPSLLGYKEGNEKLYPPTSPRPSSCSRRPVTAVASPSVHWRRPVPATSPRLLRAP